MPKSTKKTSFSDFDEIILTDSEEVVNPIIEEITEESIGEEKIVEKSGKCKNPKLIIGHENGKVAIRLKLESGDSAMFRVGCGEWQPASEKIYLETQKATQFLEVKSVNEKKHDSDILEIPIG